MKKDVSTASRSIARIFDLQRFSQNDRLAEMISNVECRYGTALSDDDLTFVNAAGEVNTGVLSDQSSDGTVEELP